MSSINPKELYLRIVTQRGTRTLCHDIVVCCGEEELTDELCERKRLEIVACMQEELEPGEKSSAPSGYGRRIPSRPAVRDNSTRSCMWRTMDFIAYALFSMLSMTMEQHTLSSYRPFLLRVLRERITPAP